MKTGYFALGLVVCLISGCKTVNYYSGEKPGGDKPSWNNDFLECEGVSKRLTGSPGDDSTLRTCLQGKGWDVRVTPKLESDW